MRNPVGINMKKDEIIVRISEGAEYKEIIECLNKKIPALKKLYKTEKTQKGIFKRFTYSRISSYLDNKPFIYCSSILLYNSRIYWFLTLDNCLSFFTLGGLWS